MATVYPLENKYEQNSLLDKLAWQLTARTRPFIAFEEMTNRQFLKIDHFPEPGFDLSHLKREMPVLFVDILSNGGPDPKF